MKTHIAPLMLLSLSLFVPAAAQSTLYENGPVGPDIDAWTISSGFIVSDTFTLSNGSDVSGISFNAWLFPGDTLTSTEVSITSLENGGSSFFDQTVSFTPSNCFTNAYGFDVCQETGHFNGIPLSGGTYWLNLQNASVSNGDPVYWDENSGVGCHSQGCPSLASESALGTIPSESFTVLGSTSSGTTPEPGSILLLGSGILGVGGMLRRKRF